jgi:hypothetical protein
MIREARNLIHTKSARLENTSKIPHPTEGVNGDMKVCTTVDSGNSLYIKHHNEWVKYLPANAPSTRTYHQTLFGGGSWTAVADDYYFLELNEPQGVDSSSAATDIDNNGVIMPYSGRVVDSMLRTRSTIGSTRMLWYVYANGTAIEFENDASQLAASEKERTNNIGMVAGIANSFTPNNVSFNAGDVLAIAIKPESGGVFNAAANDINWAITLEFNIG